MNFTIFTHTLGHFFFCHPKIMFNRLNANLTHISRQETQVKMQILKPLYFAYL